VPSTSYVVCGTPRAGTSLLTGLLKSTGIAGRPEEYFWRDDMPFWAARWIWREDAVAQAVSWAKAIQTGVWYDHVSGKPAVQSEFDFEQIERLLRAVAAHNEAWQHWFAGNEIEPLAVPYEDLASDKVGSTQRALAFLGLEVPDGLPLAEQTRAQRDALNDEWIRRFREIEAARELRR
jgi:trehalose 2-sulfotransferase